MDVKKMQQGLKDMLEYHAMEFAKDLNLFTELAPILEKLPDFDDVIGHATGVNSGVPPYVLLTYHPMDAEKAEETRSAVQAVLNVPAIRDFDKSTGKISYKLETSRVKVHVYGGRASPTCVIEPIQVTRTEYRMTCPDAEEAEVEGL